MGRNIRIVIGMVVVLGIAFFLLTARQKSLRKASVTVPAVAP